MNAVADFAAPRSAPEEVRLSSVKISQNAKGEAQVEVKVYEGATPDEVERIRQLAVSAYTHTVSEVRGNGS